MGNGAAVMPGSIISLRSRLWRVDDIRDDELTATTIESTPIEHRRFYYPFETITPGKINNPDPDKVGNYSAQDLLIRAYRLSMIHGTAPLLSLQRSRVIAESFQIVPVVMTLNMPKVKILIADDVGLGKTIEAGLIVTEMIARQRASRLLVICPASLREQWKEALDYFFHIDAEIISTQHLRSLERNIPPGMSPWEYYPYLIVSMDYAKKRHNYAEIFEQNWDIVVIDEAHNLAKPHQISPSHKVTMERWELGKKVAETAKHLILLTATPHNGYTDTYASLLSMLNVGAVSGPPHDPHIHKDIAKKHVCQRRRVDVENEFGLGEDESPFPKRNQDEVFVRLSPEPEERVIKKVEAFGNHILTVAGEEKSYRRRIAKWTVIHFHKRALSSPHALRISLKRRLNNLNDKLEKLDDIEELPINEEEARAEVLDNDTGERVTDEQAGERLDRSVFGYAESLQKEKQMIEDAIKYAKKVTPSRDSKLKELCSNVLRKMLRRDPKVIIFTRYLDTLNYLEKEIPKYPHYKNTKIVSLYGKLNDSQRRERLKEFELSPEAILIATDCLSEGVNLQYMAAQVVHYELPWNPNRLEQRNGRVDRYGQSRRLGGEKKVFIRTMVVNDSLEAGILKVLVEKANRIRVDHGFSPPFFGDDLSVLDLIQEQGLDVKIGQTRLKHFLDDDEKRQVINPFSDDVIKRMKEDNFYGQSAIDLSEVKSRMKETETLIGSSKQIQHFVESGLNKFYSSMNENQRDNTFKIEIYDSRLSQGLDYDTIPRATFDPLRGRDDPDLEVIDLGHPLVRNLIELIKEKTFTSDDTYGRTAVIKTSRAKVVSAIYTFLARYTIHTEPISIVEELLTVGVNNYSQELFKDEEVKALLESEPLPNERTIEEIRQDLHLALERKDIDEFLSQKTRNRCDQLILERNRVKESLLESGEHEWLEGFDNITPASHDLLCVTLYYPGLGGDS
jgi:SNF2 family DNA or RNA helicase